MSKEIRKFYAVRVEDLKPISGECLGESLDPDDLVYLLECRLERVVVANVRVGKEPELHEASECDCVGQRGVTLRRVA